MGSGNSPEAQLRAENAELRARLEEAQDSLRAICSGEVDALVVETANGPEVFTLQGLDAGSNRLRGEILAQVSDAVIAVDLGQCVTYLNAAAERLYRISTGDVLGFQLSHIFSRQWPSAEAEAAAWVALREHGEWRGELNHRTHDGRELQVEAWLTMFRDADGTDGGMVIAVRDVTERKRSEAEAQRVTALLDTLLHTAPIGFCFLDRDLRFVRINERLAEINGVSAEAHLGRHVSEILPGLVETVRDVTGRILATGEEVPNQEFSGETPAAPGVTRFWNQSWYPVRNGAGEVFGFGVVVEEITARKQAEAALRESHQFTRRVLDNNISAFVGVTTADGILTYANRAPLEAAGIPASEVLGKKFWNCYWWSYSAEIQAQVREACERAAGGEIVRYDVPVRMAGDTRVWIDFQVAPLRDAEGRITHLIPSAVDIEVRRAAEEKLRASEERTRLATEATAVGIWEWNVLTNTIRWDAQMFRLYGIPPTADGFVQYGDWIGAVLPEDLPETERILQDMVRRGRQSHREFRIRRRDDGEVRDIESVATVRRNEQGQGEQVVGTNLDITHRKESERQLRQAAADLTEADRRKDEFVATLAHELRNPLAPIRTGAALLRSTEGLDPRVEALATMMERQVGHMVRLVDDLLDVSRVTRGVIALQRERVPVAGVVANAVEAVGPLMREMGHALIVTMPPAPIVLDVDAVRISQVITNLLNNAAKFTDRQGQIWLTVAKSSNEVVISVTDTGIGLATADVTRIFDLFAQVGPSRGHAHGGLGIGLALSKRLVEMHGGTIHATSAGAGRGSEFVVRLPLGSEAPPALSPSDAGGHILSRTSRRILVVDDNHDGADMLSAMLRVDGHDTRTAYDGKTAMELAGAFRPEVVVLDIGLPTMSGYDVCRHLRAQPWATGLVLMAITGWGSAQDRRRAQDAGFDHHLVKPVESDALRRLLAMPIDQAGGGLESSATPRLVAPRPPRDTVDS